MKLQNTMENKVIELINQVMTDQKDYCTCNRCKLDVSAITLNHVKPKYVVTEKGELYSRADMLTTQSDADILKEITKAMDFVAKHPRH